MSTSTIEIVIDKFNNLREDEKEFTMDIISKIVAETRRNAIARNTKKALSNLKKGKVKTGSSADLLHDLEND